MVYCGNQTSYALQGVVPDEALAAEPGVVAPVVFSLQVRPYVHLYEAPT